MSHTYDRDERNVSLLAFDQYMRAVRWTPPLSEEEEAQLLARLERGKVERLQPLPNAWRLQLAEHARARLVEGYQLLVIAIAKGHAYRGRSMELSDLIQEGNLGLLRALDTNDASKGYPLRVLATICIRGAIRNALYERDGMVRIGSRTRAVLRQMRQAEQRLLSQLGRQASLAEVAAEMQIAEARLRQVVALQRREQVESLQAVFSQEGMEDHADFVSLFEAAVLAQRQQDRVREQRVQAAIEASLTPRQQEIIRLRYGLDGEDVGERSFGAVSDLLGITRSGVESVASRARKRLHDVLAPVVGLVPEDVSA